MLNKISCHCFALSFHGAEILSGNLSGDNDVFFIAIAPLDLTVKHFGGECTHSGIVGISDCEGIVRSVAGFLEVPGIVTLVGAAAISQGVILYHFRQALQGIGKWTGHDIAVVPLVIHKVTLQTIQALIVLNAMVIGGLIDNLRHQQVKCRERHDQTYQVEGGRQLKPPGHVENISKNLSHSKHATNIINIFKIFKTLPQKSKIPRVPSIPCKFICIASWCFAILWLV